MVILSVNDLGKRFTLHLRDGVTITVLQDASFDVNRGECVALTGESGCGKSSLLKLVYGNYGANSGSIQVLHNGQLVEITERTPREIDAIRKNSVGYVSQFLRVVPRVSAQDIVSQPLTSAGADDQAAHQEARDLLARLNLPEAIWCLPPATFSGGEQQRVNVARGFINDSPLLLLDEPTASLDAANRDVVIDLIKEKKRRGTAILGIFHDRQVRDKVADRQIDVTAFSPEAA